MWAQNWRPLLDLLVGGVDDVVDPLLERNLTVRDMVRRWFLAWFWKHQKPMSNESTGFFFGDVQVVMAEDFYRSLGFEQLPASFWTRSQFVRPDEGRSSVCHPSAVDLQDGDVR